VNPKELAEAFYREREEFGLIAADELSNCSWDLLSERTAPSQAHTFAEALIMCPDIESARVRVQRDTRGARAFVKYLGWIDVIPDRFMAKLCAEFEGVTSQGSTRFYVLASVARSVLESGALG
jgi:hypothetical protein